jgi:hypothetical protein
LEIAVMTQPDLDYSLLPPPPIGKPALSRWSSVYGWVAFAFVLAGLGLIASVRLTGVVGVGLGAVVGVLGGGAYSLLSLIDRFNWPGLVALLLVPVTLYLWSLAWVWMFMRT